MKLQLRQTSEVFYISTVYARCDALDRLELWKDLESLSDHSDVFWMVGGDFNVILDEAENLGGSQVTQQEMVDFATCVNICSLNEQKFYGSNYTQWNNRIEEDCIFKRLYRVLRNNEFM